MSTLIDYAISHARLTIATLLSSCCSAGFVAYVTIPKEAEPDVKIPIIYVAAHPARHQPGGFRAAAAAAGRDPAQVGRQRQGNALDRLRGRRLRAARVRGRASIPKSALADVRAKVDEAKRDLPNDADEPSVQEVNLSLYPVLVVALAGDVPERTLLRIARSRQERDRAGAGRALGRTARRARRGGRDHRRADADEELRRLARPAASRRRRRPTAWSPPARSKARPAASPSRCRR